jgi:16S rRNA (cytosine1402-N4)-methyltransferase
MLDECLNGLNLKPEGIYVDVTFGGGGHSKAIVERLTTGHLYGFDQDIDAQENAKDFAADKFTFVEANFRYLKRFLKAHGVKQVDGILADLGVSSHQINTPDRGFSTRFEGVLDMRMDKSIEKTAEVVVNEYSEKDLHKILGIYGEVKNAKSLAHAIVQARINKKLKTTTDLKSAIQHLAPKGKDFKYMAQVFQALRIEVNEELKTLEELLLQSAEVLKPGGRLVVMSYHSLEDRLVKNFINKGKFYGEVEKDVYGNFEKPLEAVTRKPVEATEEEVKNNPRARSAKLRVAEKL